MSDRSPSVTFRRALPDAGLHEIQIETAVKDMPFGPVRHLWDWLTNPVPNLVLTQLQVTPAQTAR